MILYVSGPMTGRPSSNYPAFNRVECRLRELGYDVLNPARHGRPDRGWVDYMRLALVDLAASDGVCTLPGWPESRGASLEVHIAKQLDIPVRDLLDWKARA